MIYTIYADNYLIYPDDNATDVRLQLTLGQAGLLSFTIFDTHPNLARLTKLQAVIRVYQDDVQIWQGRVIASEQAFDNRLNYTCEGYLATLNDTIMAPTVFDGTIGEFVELVIGNHNTLSGRNLLLTTIENDTTEIQRSWDSHLTTWEILKSRLTDLEGGYLTLAFGEAGIYLGYQKTFNTTSSQVIEYGENLQDLQNIIDATETYTAVWPLGVETVLQDAPTEENPNPPETRKRLDITAVNGGTPYITNPTYTALYGVIFAPMDAVTWDDITVDSNLLAKAQAALAEGIKFKQELNIAAIDLAHIYEVDAYKIGDSILVQSTPHGISLEYLLEALEIDISYPENTTITLGRQRNTITDVVLGQQEKAARSENYIERIIKDYVVNVQMSQIYTELEEARSSILQTANQIITEVLANYVTVDAMTAYETEVSTRFTQTENAFGFDFLTKTVQSVLDAQTGTIDEQLQELRRYVRIVDGVMYFGASDSPISLEIGNSSIVFKQNGTAVATMTNNSLEINYADINTQINIGAFAFVPRADGNMSFKKL